MNTGSTTQTVGETVTHTLKQGAAELLYEILRGQSTTELKRRRDISDEAYGLCYARQDYVNAEIYREMSYACSDVISKRVVFVSPDSWYFTEWERPTNKYGSRVRTFDLRKICYMPWCMSNIVNPQLAISRSGRQVGYNSCPTHREDNATMIEDAFDPFVVIGAKAGQGALRRKEMRCIKADATEIMARLNRAVQL